MSQHPLESLYRDHYSWLYRWLRGRLNCDHSAADLAQDTYLKLMVAGAIPQDNAPRRYLTRIAKSLMIDLYRRRQIEQAYLEAISQLPEQSVPSEETRAMVTQALMEIDNMLKQLPKKVRQAFLLRKIDGLSYKDIARQLDVSISSVEKYVARALAACYLYTLTHH